MAFDIGQKVTSSFTGNGVVVGEVYKVEDDGKTEAMQVVEFENPRIGKRPWAVKKLRPLDEEELA